MVLSNPDAAEIAFGYVAGLIGSLDDEYGDIAEATQEAHHRAVDEDYTLVTEYVTDWRIRLQRFMNETGAI